VIRRRVAGIAAGLLLALILLGQSWAELPRRVRSLVAFAPKELAVRRLGGSGTAFDRRYFSFLENVRRSLPPDTAGVDFSLQDADPRPRWLLGYPDASYEYLGTYYLAPRQVNFGGFGQWGSPKGWIHAVYGPYPGLVFKRLPEGVLLAPATGESGPVPRRVPTP
jgi:hypothetical protein